MDDEILHLETPLLIFPGSSSDFLQLETLLVEWNLQSLLPTLIENDITVERLKYLSPDDIKELIPKIGLRAEFRSRISALKRKESDLEDTTVSVNSKIDEWWSTSDSGQISLQSGNTSELSLTNNLNEILIQHQKGKAVLEFYKKNQSLLDNHRQDLINIILERAFTNDIQLRPAELEKICNQIAKIFPNERKDYYYIPRGIRKNPGGKLYDKYHNLQNKKRKIARPVENADKSPEIDCFEQEIDEDFLKNLKSILQKDFSNLTTVEDYWSKTFILRRRELKTSKSNSEFLENWPAVKQSFGYKLVSIDFRLLYPGKENILIDKWNDFLKKVHKYYEYKINDQKSREYFVCSKQIKNQESINYIAATLLNSVITPTARFQSKEGNNKRKFTIADAQESFVLHLTSINNYKIKIDALKEKYYLSSLTLQPIIIVLGEDIYQLKEFFVCFDDVLYKLKSFIECLNTCFEIFNVLNLSYPKACQGVWLFVQKYFFEITTKFDFQSPNVAALLNYFQSDIDESIIAIA